MLNNVIFEQLKSILAQYESSLTVLHNKSDNYYLNTPITNKNKKPEFFGAVQIKKSYVAFHLMPVYYHPELLATISEELKSKMQGKSCFNFKKMEEQLFKELTLLTKACYNKYTSVEKI
ncbi:MAG: hypothetical protein MUE72_07875 [Chitinophagaceae bacterium]|jgi:hypothetical protein|nr:hypothetical protein [Chitinophagaceae bacterium]